MTARVISVSGPPGAGKSTLVAGLAARLGGVVVEYDHYETITRWSPQEVLGWLDDGAPFDRIVAQGLYDSVCAAGDLVFLETPFGRGCPETGGLITQSIWLECPADLALARKLDALAKDSLGRAGFAEEMSAWLVAYQTFTRRALQMQRDRVRPLADIVVSSEAEPEKVLSSAIAEINFPLQS